MRGTNTESVWQQSHLTSHKGKTGLPHPVAEYFHRRSARSQYIDDFKHNKNGLISHMIPLKSVWTSRRFIFGPWSLLGMYDSGGAGEFADRLPTRNLGSLLPS